MLLGFALALVVAVPLGFALGLFPYVYQALNPFIQVLRPISPLAWMPLALYTFRDSGISAIFIIFICALWPMLINTAVGAANVRQEWVNVSRVFGFGTFQHVTRIMFPASVPMIMTGMRISIGIAWFVIVAAEMVGAQSGIGYFIWNEWNNLQLASMIVAIVLIGIIGLGLDSALAWIAKQAELSRVAHGRFSQRQRRLDGVPGQGQRALSGARPDLAWTWRRTSSSA